MTLREEVIELVNKLFIYTDEKEWQKLQNDIFAEEVFLDMESAGGNSETMTSEQICSMWQSVLNGLDAANHLTGNFIVENVKENFVKVFCYATATHYKSSAKNGSLREFVGSYNIELIKQANGWRVTSFVYNLKYMSGNLDLL